MHFRDTLIADSKSREAVSASGADLLARRSAATALGCWFQDTPAHYEGAPDDAVDPLWNTPGVSWTSVFDLALATTSVEPDGTTLIDIYGGYQWGYTLTIVDTPEPSTLALLLGAVGLLGYWRRRKGKRGSRRLA